MTVVQHAGRRSGQGSPFGAPCVGRRRGSVMVLFALMLPGIIALMGLVIDMGRLLAERRQLQAAADASAWAAANEVLWGTPSNAGAVAQWYAQQNGYGPTSDATVTVSQPPTSGAYVGQSEYVQVTLRRPLTLTLAQIVHPDPITISVTSTAGPQPGARPVPASSLSTARAAAST